MAEIKESKAESAKKIYKFQGVTDRTLLSGIGPMKIKCSYKNYERNRANNKLVRTILEIHNRKPHYVDIMEQTATGQPVYKLISHSRGINLSQPDYAIKHVTMTERSGMISKIVPHSNLNQRKRQVLKVHAENLKMVQRLAEMKANQSILINNRPGDRIFNGCEHRSKSADGGV